MTAIKIAFAGNPNAGKTTLFNALTGLRLKTGNYAGVTVDKTIVGKRFDKYHLSFVDLPGIYSLTAYSPDEIITRDFLLNEKPSVIIDVVDSTNLERNLLLCVQFLELQIPIVVALNMSDEAETHGIIIDEKLLSELLGIPFLKTSAIKKIGLDELMETTINEAENSVSTPPKNTIIYSDEVERELGKVLTILARATDLPPNLPPRWLAIKLLEKDAWVEKIIRNCAIYHELSTQVEQSNAWLEKHYGMDAEIIISELRYGYLRGAIIEAVTQKNIQRKNITERLDAILMNRFLGLPILLATLWAIFQVTFSLGKYPVHWLESFFTLLSELVTNNLPTGFWQSLIADGMIAGVGGVLSFVPLIIILFLFLSILEDTGYMSRAAFIVDKFLHLFGLHGQSFVPMIIGFGCSVPAIMAARTLKNSKDRILTILIIPFMSCGAKMPVYMLFAAAFFEHQVGNIVLSIYVAGVVLAFITAIILNKTIFKNRVTPLIMELPPYRLPTTSGILWHIGNKTWSYAKKAGTVILFASIIIWLITTFPRPPLSSNSPSETRHEKSAIEYSAVGQIGHFIEPLFRPLGFNWQISISALTGFAAKETVISTLGILYRSEGAVPSAPVTAENADEPTPNLRTALKNDAQFSALAAYTLMLFILLFPPCLATLATLRAELGAKWLAISMSLNIGLAWLVCLAVYQIGRWFIAI